MPPPIGETVLVREETKLARSGTAESRGETLFLPPPPSPRTDETNDRVGEAPVPTSDDNGSRRHRETEEEEEERREEEAVERAQMLASGIGAALVRQSDTNVRLQAALARLERAKQQVAAAEAELLAIAEREVELAAEEATLGDRALEIVNDAVRARDRIRLAALVASGLSLHGNASPNDVNFPLKVAALRAGGGASGGGDAEFVAWMIRMAATTSEPYCVESELVPLIDTCVDRGLYRVAEAIFDECHAIECSTLRMLRGVDGEREFLAKALRLCDPDTAEEFAADDSNDRADEEPSNGVNEDGGEEDDGDDRDDGGRHGADEATTEADNVLASAILW